MIKEINFEALELTKLVSRKPIEINNGSSQLTGSIKERGFTDLSDKFLGFSIERTVDILGKTIEIFKHDENEKIGLNIYNYPKFEKLVQKIHSIEEINKLTSISFIESELFSFIINIYKHPIDNSSIYDSLLNSINEKVKKHTFYFPLINLDIEESFIIGNVEFIYFTKEYLDDLYKVIKKENKELTKESFDQIFRNDFQGHVLAKVNIRAEKDKAEELARIEAEISVDTLKLYSGSAIVPEIKTMFDLNFRVNYQMQANFLSQNPDEDNNLIINTRFNNKPFSFTKKQYLLAYRSGLKILSQFIKIRNNSELTKIIIQSIKLYGSALSNWDLHLRCVNIITILESILLKDEEAWKMESKVKARLGIILSNDLEEQEAIKNILSNIYKIRHKLIHKAIKLDINYKELSQVQFMIVNLFLRLITFDSELGFKDKTSLINEIDEQI